MSIWTDKNGSSTTSWSVDDTDNVEQAWSHEDGLDVIGTASPPGVAVGTYDSAAEAAASVVGSKYHLFDNSAFFFGTDRDIRLSYETDGSGMLVRVFPALWNTNLLTIRNDSTDIVTIDDTDIKINDRKVVQDGLFSSQSIPILSTVLATCTAFVTEQCLAYDNGDTDIVNGALGMHAKMYSSFTETNPGGIFFNGNPHNHGSSLHVVPEVPTGGMDEGVKTVTLPYADGTLMIEGDPVSRVGTSPVTWDEYAADQGITGDDDGVYLDVACTSFATPGTGLTVDVTISGGVMTVTRVDGGSGYNWEVDEFFNVSGLDEAILASGNNPDTTCVGGSAYKITSLNQVSLFNLASTETFDGTLDLTQGDTIATTDYVDASSGTELNDLTSAVTWDNIPIANVPTGTSSETVALGDHTHTGAQAYAGTVSAYGLVVSSDGELGTAYSVSISSVGKIKWEGSTADEYETNLGVDDPTAMRNINLPNASGTVALTADLSGFITGYTVTQSDVTDQEDHLTITESQISDLGSYITDYTVTQGDVTGHQAALSITESQISDLGSYITGYTVTSGDVTAHEGDIDHDNLTNAGGNTHIDWTAGYSYNMSVGSITVGGAALSGAANSVTIDNTNGGEMIWEGPDADGIETHLRAATATTSSKIITLPDDTGTVALTGSAASQDFSGSVTALNFLAGATSGAANSIHISSADGSIIFEGSTADEFETKLNVIDPTAANLITLPDNGGTIALTSDITGTNSNTNTGDVCSTNHTGAGYITGYTVTEGDVTGHEAALSITESQISDLGSYLTSETSHADVVVDADIGVTVQAYDSTNMTLAGGTMTGSIIMGGSNVSGAGGYSLDEVAAHTGSLQADIGLIYLNNSAELILKVSGDGVSNGSRILTGIEQDSAAKLGSDLDLNGNNIVGINGSKLYWAGDEVGDQYFELDMENVGAGRAIFKITADIEIDGQMSDSDGSTFIKNEDDMASGSDLHIATQASIRNYVRANHHVYLKSGFNYNQTAGTKVYVPIGSAENARETSSLSGSSENTCWIAPHDGEVIGVQFRSSTAADEVVLGFHTCGDGTAVPHYNPDVAVTVDCDTADTTYYFDFSMQVGRTFSKGELLMFSIEPDGTDPNDVLMQFKIRLDTHT